MQLLWFLMVASMAILEVPQVRASSFREKVEATCANELKSINSVDEMRAFGQELKDYLKVLFQEDKYPNFIPSIQRCYDERETIFQISDALRYDDLPRDVCHPKRVRRLIRYYLRKIYNSGEKSLVFGWMAKKPMVYNFYRRYLLQVALVCRQNLIENLEEVDKKFTKDDFYISAVIEKREIGKCLKLSPYYTTTVTPLMQLAVLGFAWDDKKLDYDEDITENQSDMVRKWFTAAAVCSNYVLKYAFNSSEHKFQEYSRNAIDMSEPLNVDDEFANRYLASSAKNFIAKFAIDISGIKYVSYWAREMSNSFPSIPPWQDRSDY